MQRAAEGAARCSGPWSWKAVRGAVTRCAAPPNPTAATHSRKNAGKRRDRQRALYCTQVYSARRALSPFAWLSLQASRYCCYRLQLAYILALLNLKFR